MIEELTRLRVRVSEQARVEAHHQQMVGPIARTVRHLLAESPIHEQRDDEQNHGHRDLAANEHRASPAAPTSGCDGVAGFHDAGQIGTRRVNRRHESEDDRARRRDSEAQAVNNHIRYMALGREYLAAQKDGSAAAMLAFRVP